MKCFLTFSPRCSPFLMRYLGFHRQTTGQCKDTAAEVPVTTSMPRSVSRSQEPDEIVPSFQMGKPRHWKRLYKLMIRRERIQTRQPLSEPTLLVTMPTTSPLQLPAQVLPKRRKRSWRGKQGARYQLNRGGTHSERRAQCCHKQD